MDCSTAKCYSIDWDSYPCPQGHLPGTLTNWATSLPPDFLEVRFHTNWYMLIVLRHLSQVLVVHTVSAAVFEPGISSIWWWCDSICTTYWDSWIMLWNYNTVKKTGNPRNYGHLSSLNSKRKECNAGFIHLARWMIERKLPDTCQGLLSIHHINIHPDMDLQA